MRIETAVLLVASFFASSCTFQPDLEWPRRVSIEIEPNAKIEGVSIDVVALQLPAGFSDQLEIALHETLSTDYGVSILDSSGTESLLSYIKSMESSLTDTFFLTIELVEITRLIAGSSDIVDATFVIELSQLNIESTEMEAHLRIRAKYLPYRPGLKYAWEDPKTAKYIAADIVNVLQWAEFL